VQDRATASGLKVLAARGRLLEQGFAFGVARQLLARELIGAAPERRTRLLTGAAGLAEPVLLDVGAAADREATVYGLVWLVTALADEAPLLVLVDDLHWSDASSRALLVALVQRIRELPVALLMTSRPAPRGREGLEGIATVLPGRLSADGTARLLEQVLGGRPAAPFVAAAHRTTGGTPFLVGAIGEAARRAGMAPRTIRPEVVEALAGEGFAPELARRLGALPHEAGEVVRALAVAGDDAPASLLAAATQRPLEDVRSILAGLQTAGLLSTVEPPAFTHALVRSAVLDDLDAGRAGELHGRLGRLRAAAGDLELAAAHFEQAPPAADGQAARVLATVARSARRRGDIGRAVSLLQRAVMEPPPAGERAAVLFRLGRLEVASTDPAGPERLAAAAITAAAEGNPTLSLRAGVAQGQGLAIAGRWSEGLAVIREAIDGGGSADPDALRLARIELVSEQLPVRADGSARRERERLLRSVLDGSGDDLDRLATGVLAFLVALEGAPRAEVVALVESALAQGVVTSARTPAALQPLFALVVGGAPERAEPFLEAVVAGTRARGSLALTRTISAWHGMALLYDDRLVEAQDAAVGTGSEEEADGQLAVARLLGASVRGLLALERSDFSAAAAELDPPLERPTDVATTFHDGYLVARARLRFAQGDAAGAWTIVSGAGERLVANGMTTPGPIQWRTDAVHYALALGRRDEACTLAGTRWRLPPASARRARWRRPCAHARRPRAIRPGARRPCTMPWTSWGPTGCTASARSRWPRSPRCRSGRRPGRRCGPRSTLPGGPGRSGLRSSSVLHSWPPAGDPRRSVLSGADALTPAEGRTARRAAAGATNRQIAEELFLTQSTVEGHLTNAYRKLGISHRSELASALGDPTASPADERSISSDDESARSPGLLSPMGGR
jgi:DNA-binding CsgD family transcriptional regulator/tetratricopeptide (TPR) repeat protein